MQDVDRLRVNVLGGFMVASGELPNAALRMLAYRVLKLRLLERARRPTGLWAHWGRDLAAGNWQESIHLEKVVTPLRAQVA